MLIFQMTLADITFRTEFRFCLEILSFKLIIKENTFYPRATKYVMYTP